MLGFPIQDIRIQTKQSSEKERWKQVGTLDQIERLKRNENIRNKEGFGRFNSNQSCILEKKIRRPETKYERLKTKKEIGLSLTTIKALTLDKNTKVETNNHV